jgi:hypothetical protein
MDEVVQRYFSAATWAGAFEGLAQAEGELGGQAVQRALAETMTPFAPFDITHAVLGAQLHVFDVARRNGLFAARALADQIGAPKFGLDAVSFLSQVRDADTARAFFERFPDLWCFLIVEHAVRGAHFWRLLFASARSIEGAFPLKDALLKTTVVIARGDDQRRIFKIIPLSEGGFALTAPYHAARQGMAMKIPPMQTGSHEIAGEDMAPFGASDRVKLSYHIDGFAQFSGEQGGTIRSGRDPATGAPKGLGVLTRPLIDPIQSGPSAGCLVWGLDAFEPWRPKASEHQVIFASEEDYFTEPDPGDDDQSTSAAAHSISVFVFPTNLLREALEMGSTPAEITLRLPMNIYNRDSVFRVKLARGSDVCTLGLIANRLTVNFPTVSGFQLSGPGDDSGSLAAIYPSHAIEERSIDY